MKFRAEPGYGRTRPGPFIPALLGRDAKTRRILPIRLPAPYDEASDRVGYAEGVSSASRGALLGKRSGVRSPTA
jgi:hypothetical protein